MNNIKKLPDSYRKDKDSNNYKLMLLNELSIKDLKKDMQDVLTSLDINKATGKTLELFGDIVSQKRGLLNDTQYRYMIFTKIGRNIVRGDYTSIMDTIVQMFGAEHGDISLNDIGVEEAEEACVVKLSKFPVQVLVDAGFSSRQAVQMIETLLPICVTLSADNFEGTFEFAELDGTYDEKAGFADTQRLIGGFLGLLLGDDDKIPVLPL